MDLISAIRELIPGTPWIAVAWLLVGFARYLQAGQFIAEWSRPWLARRWVTQLRRTGASDKQIRAFLTDYALNRKARSP